MSKRHNETELFDLQEREGWNDTTLLEMVLDFTLRNERQADDLMEYLHERVYPVPEYAEDEAAEFPWAVVDTAYDHSVVDRYETQDEALAALSTYPNLQTLVVAYVPSL